MRRILASSTPVFDRIHGARARNRHERARFRPAPETLESRSLLSSVVDFNGAILAASKVAGPIAYSPASVRGDSPLEDRVEIDINDTRDDGDNITLFNPSTTSQSYAQTIPARITNQGTAEGIFQLSVDPPGAATLSKISLDLAASASTEVTITPESDSSALNDVHIIATQGNVPAGMDAMTIVSVTFPQDIRNADTPASMIDRIPPRVNTAVPVQVTPNLSGSSLSVGVAVSNQDANSGTVTLDGGSTATLSSSGTVEIRGVTQTAFPALPGDFQAPYGGKLQLAVEVRGTDTVRSDGFSVAAIPENFSESFLAKARGQWRGIVVQVAWSSDSGVVADLNAVQLNEEVEVVAARGIFVGIGIETGGWIAATGSGEVTDTHAIRVRSIKKPGGALIISQTHIFRDQRTGSVGIPVNDSGYLIIQRVFASPRTRKWKIQTTKEGYATSANGFASGAGQGYIGLTVKK